MGRGYAKIIILLLLLIVFLFLFLFYLLTNSQVRQNTTASSGGSLNTPDQMIEQTKTYCSKNGFERIVLDSLKKEDKGYEAIDIGDKSYLEQVQGLCKALLNVKDLEKSKISEEYWNYIFVLSKSPRISFGYSIVYFNNQWRFLFFPSARL